MKTYDLAMVPGPVSVPQAVLQAYQTNYGSGDLEADYLELYRKTEAKLQQIFVTQNQIVIQSGEAMVVLWGALKSCLQPGDRVLAIASGLFGYAIANIATSVGADVQTIDLGYDKTITDWGAIEQAIVEFHPKMITLVHCETPSGTLNPVAQLGQLKQRYDVPLLFVDAVASVGGVPVLTDDWHIDLCLTGSQKCLSMPPCLGILAVSDAAWDIIDTVDYKGYDALKPFRTVPDTPIPYTPYWHGLAALDVATDLILDEGLEAVYMRHETAAAYCRQAVQALGYTLFPADNANPSPTVTAINVPEDTLWTAFNIRLREQGLVVGGNYGPLAEKVFRLGHMGSQADVGLLEHVMAVLKQL